MPTPYCFQVQIRQAHLWIWRLSSYFFFQRINLIRYATKSLKTFEKSVQQLLKHLPSLNTLPKRKWKQQAKTKNRASMCPLFEWLIVFGRHFLLVLYEVKAFIFKEWFYRQANNLKCGLCTHNLQYTSKYWYGHTSKEVSRSSFLEHLFRASLWTESYKHLFSLYDKILMKADILVN